jgi:hypothetical protein
MFTRYSEEENSIENVEHEGRTVHFIACIIFGCKHRPRTNMCSLYTLSSERPSTEVFLSKDLISFTRVLAGFGLTLKLLQQQ